MYEPEVSRTAISATKKTKRAERVLSKAILTNARFSLLVEDAALNQSFLFIRHFAYIIEFFFKKNNNNNINAFLILHLLQGFGIHI